MPGEFLESLVHYYITLGQVLRGQADQAAIFPNPTDRGGTREEVYKRFLADHLPGRCSVMSGGFLFSQTGEVSKQMDILVMDGSALRFSCVPTEPTGKAFACVDGCVAVASIKSTLDSGQLKDALDNLASLPDKTVRGLGVSPFITIPDFDDWPLKIIYASGGIAYHSAWQALHRFYEDRPDVPPRKKPDVIHVAGQYAIIRNGFSAATLADGSVVPPDSYYPLSGKHVDAFALLYTARRIQTIAVAFQHVLTDYQTLLVNVVGAMAEE